MARKRPVRYRCWDCAQEFSIQIIGTEQRGAQDEGHDEASPGCGQAVGKDRVKCRHCRAQFILELPHWHAGCGVAAGDCPHCGATNSSACNC